MDELIRRGHSVTVLDDLSTGSEANLAAVRGKIDLIIGTITDRATLDRSCRGAEVVLHLAARTSVPRSVQDPAETNRVNVDGTLDVLLAARDAGARRVVFASSSSVYGDTPTLPKREDMPPAPISPYGVSKLVGELYGQVFRRVYGIEFVALRYFNVFGPRQNPGSPYSGVLSLFAAALRDSVPPKRLWRRRTVPRLHLRTERRRAEHPSLRNTRRLRDGLQRRDRWPLHPQLHAQVVRKICRALCQREIRRAS